MAVSGRHDADGLTELMAEQSAPLCEWLIDGLGVRMRLITAYRHIGHSVERLHAPASRRGQDLVDDLLRCVAERGIPLAVGNPVDGLLADGDAVTGAVVTCAAVTGDAVTGAVVTGAVVAGEPVRAAKVLIATNGFAADREMVLQHCPEIAGAEYFGAPGSTGEAVRWAAPLGAALGNMGAYQGYAAVAYPQGQLLSWTTIEKGGILVGRDGRRFGNEDAGYSGFAPAVMAQGPVAFAVYDRRIHEIAAQEEEYAEMAQMGAVRWAESPQALAEAAGVDAAGLADAIESYNASALGEAQDPFGRRAFGLAPLTPPLGTVLVKPGLFHTQGGLLVDRDARVQRKAGGVVPNLFAGGGAAAGISGRTGAAGYASGNGLLTALGLGRIAGLRAAAEVKGEA